MGTFPAPRYALVGERTMAKLTLSNAFSWKWGFLENKQKCISNRNVNWNNLPKGLTKVASLDATINHDQAQWKISTSITVAMTAAANSKTTNLALLFASTRSEVAFHKTHVCNKPANLSAQPSLPMSKGPIPYKTEGFNEDHLHCALPICGLPPEEQPHIYNTRHMKQEVQPSHQCEAQFMVTHASEAIRMDKGHGLDANLPHVVDLPTGDSAKPTNHWH